MNVPKLRFGEFSGEWESYRLGNVIATTQLGGDYTNSEKPTTFPLIKMGNLARGNICLNKIEYVVSDEIVSDNDLLHKDDLLFNTRNTLELVGKTAIWKNNLPAAYFNSNIMRITFKEDIVELNSYMNFYFNTRGMLKKLRSIATGTTSVAAIYFKDSKNLKVSLPTLPEQQKIADFLSTFDERIENQQSIIKNLERQKKGYMQKIFSRELRFKDQNGNDFPQWEEKKLEEVCVINPKADILPDTFMYIDLESVSDGILQQKKFVEKTTAPSRAQRLLQVNDILYQMVRPYQKNNYLCRLNDENSVASTGYAQLRCSENSPNFLYQYLHYDGFVSDVLIRCTGTSYPAINSTDLSEINIEIPVLSEQQKIADFLSAVDEKIQTEKQILTHLQNTKKGLLQQMFC